MKDTIFREYDIRGVVNDELSLDRVYDLACAIAAYLTEKNPAVTTVALGMDGRTHSPAIKQELCRGLVDSGLSVTFLGVCTSPALYFALHTLPVQAGIMITASHNPKQYNGLKILLGTESVSGKEIAAIKDLFKARSARAVNKKGGYQEYDIIEPYVAQLIEKLPHLQGMKLAAVIDCGNGAAGTVVPALVKRFEWKHVHLLYPEVDGTYPHHEADPTVEKNMADVKEVLTTTACSLGVGLDGDADRMAAMTKEGQLVVGDRLLALFAQHIAKENLGATVVFDVNASNALIQTLKKIGLRGHMSPVGFTFVKEHAKQQHAILAGELSCHFLFKDRYLGFDDGIYAMLRLFEIVTQTGKTLTELLATIPTMISTPAIRMLCKEEDKKKIVAAVGNYLAHKPGLELITIDGVRAQFPHGWGIIRASNTEPKIMVRFEADDQESMREIKQEFCQALEPFFDSAQLHAQLGLSH
jgi:phosphomannomutase